MNVVVAGSSGLIGSALVDRLAERGHRAVRLVRDGNAPAAATRAGGRADEGPGPAAEVTTLRWDPNATRPDDRALADAGPVDGAVNLAGAGVADRRWSARRKHEIRDSRLSTTRRLADLLAACTPRPRVLVNASAIGYYGDRGDEILTESSPAGRGFLAELCAEWEAAAERITTSGVRVVVIRTGIVLAPGGGVLSRQVPLFRLGLGGRLGSGRQYRSWISLEDEVAAIVRCLEDETVSGPVNLTAPHPVTEAEMAEALGRALHRPARLAVPAVALQLALGREMAGELLASQRVLPGVLEDLGFAFAHPRVDEALGWALGR